MDDPKDVSIHTDSSDSDEDLNVPEFSKIFTRKPTETSTPTEFKDKNSSSPKTNRLDTLLSDHVKEAAERTRLERVKEQLMQDLQNESQEELQAHSQSLASEHEDHLQQLDVKSSEPLDHPGIQLFHPEKFGCLYLAQTSLFACGFTSSGSSIDKILTTTTPGTLTNLLLSKALVTCVQQISDLSSVLIWLLNILAVHPSPVTAHSCYINLIGILHQFKVNALSSTSPEHQSWFPHPLSILRIFVNLGAQPQDILGKYNNIPQDEIRNNDHLMHPVIWVRCSTVPLKSSRKFLVVENDENKDHHKTAKGHLSKENLQLVFKVIATALQTHVSITRENLSQIFFMIAKVQLDNSVNRLISLEAQTCFSALLQCYREEDWPSVVPDLCRRLYDVSDHHHNQVHLVDLLPGTSRGSFLQVRISYICLRALLQPAESQPEDAEILNLRLADVPNLCCCNERPPVSPLAKALKALLEKDMYKMISAIKFLDMCVGDDLYRSAQPWQSLEYLIEQVNLIMIKDNISAIDLSKIKDSLSKLKVKWSLSLQDHRRKQRSIFPWLSQTSRSSVTQEVLQAHQSLLDDDSE